MKPLLIDALLVVLLFALLLVVCIVADAFYQTVRMRRRFEKRIAENRTEFEQRRAEFADRRSRLHSIPAREERRDLPPEDGA